MAILAAAAVYYLFLLSNGTFALFAPEQYDRAFGSMLTHMLRGDLTVDRETIGSEAFTRDGRTYSYFGIFPALLRLVALPFVDLAQAHLARLSCLVAMVGYVGFLLRSVLLIHRSAPTAAQNGTLLTIMVAALLLSGPQVYLLGSAWIFHEPVFWAAAMSAMFNYVLLSAVFGDDDDFDISTWIMLALTAGAALITRPSVGLSLCVAASLMTAWMWLVRHGLVGAPARHGRSSLAAMALDNRLWAPVAILAGFTILAGAINYGRWGNPLTFADFRFYDFAHREPHRLQVILNYGEMNFSRVWISSLYYATGIPYVLKGVSPFAEYLRVRFDGLEAPPISGLMTNPLTILLAAFGLYQLARRPALVGRHCGALRLALVGHAAAVILILGAMYLALRYRLDFSGFMTLAALIGFRGFLLAQSGFSERRRRLLQRAAGSLALIGIAFSHYILIVHKVWSTGVPMEVRRALLPLAPFARSALAP